MFEAGDAADGIACPHCGNFAPCAHLLLIVNRTFREAEGGALCESFNRRWSASLERGGPDFDEREAFEELLERIGLLVDAQMEWEQDSAPGMSATRTAYYVRAVDRALLAWATGGG
jgi:hypothetical protein